MEFAKTQTYEKTFDLLESGNLNWNVSKEALFSADGKGTKSYGLFRTDNNQWLGSVGEKYQPFQNSSLVETIVDACEQVGLQSLKSGLLQDGRKVFIQAELEDDFIGKSGIKRNITATNSHDGTMSIGFGSTNTVIVCNNTFHRAYKEINKIRHFVSAEERVRQAVAELKHTMALDNSLMQSFKKMSQVAVTKSAIERVMERCFDIDINDKSEKNKRTMARAESIAEAIETEFNLEGSTMWGLFNGITRYTNHVHSYKTEDDRLSSLLTGTAYRTNLVAYDEVMKWVEKHTDKSTFIMA